EVVIVPPTSGDTITTSSPVILFYLAEKYNGEEVVIVSPDVGGAERARRYATRLDNADIAIIDKRRSGPNQVAEMKVIGNVAGKSCIIVDDMVDTGGTLIKAGEALIAEGAKQVSAVCTHPVMSSNAAERLNQSIFQEVIVTDTIPISQIHHGKKIKVLSVAPIFAEAIRRIHNEDSVSSLFN
ncbi:MAG: ribose-phosphate diphosphokinase, partial [Bdellovibrionales bacterium]|nr:ribose-phosphate diphosphokinase [Bdellovibrionales bacterium]